MSPLGALGNGQPSAEEMAQLQNEMEREREERNAATQMASQAAMENRGTEPGYWDTIGDADIGNEDNLESYAETEFSNKHALANIRYADWESWQWRIETEFWTMQNEMKDADTKMGDDDLRIMYGEDRPTLDNKKARKLRSAQQVKKLMTSLSVDARGLRSGTEIHAVAKTEKQDSEHEDQGRLSRWKRALV